MRLLLKEKFFQKFQFFSKKSVLRFLSLRYGADFRRSRLVCTKYGIQSRASNIYDPKDFLRIWLKFLIYPLPITTPGKPKKNICNETVNKIVQYFDANPLTSIIKASKTLNFSCFISWNVLRKMENLKHTNQ